MDPNWNIDDFRQIPDPLGKAPDQGTPPDEHAPIALFALSALPASRSRAQAARDRWGALVAVVVVQAISVLVVRTRDMSASMVAVGAIVPALAAFVAGMVAYRSRSRDVGVRTLLGAALPVGVFVLTAFFTRSPAPVDLAREIHPTLVCLALSTGFTIAPLLAFGFALRQSFASAATSRAVALGISLGVIGAITLRLHCPDDAFIHLLVGHGGALVFGAVVGALAGRRILRA